MTCYAPLHGWDAIGGGFALSRRNAWLDRPKSVACGTCLGCKLDRGRQYAIRGTHEQSGYEANSFVTFTYDETHVPRSGSLEPAHIRDLWKRLRKAGYRFRYLQCGEYGSKNLRPHHHAILFGEDFKADREPVQRQGQGDQLYESPDLTAHWGKGNVWIGDVTPASISYVAGYCLKSNPKDHPAYELAEPFVDTDTGEVLTHRRPEYITLSLKPGLGHDWISRYWRDVYRLDEVIHQGRRSRPPRYYDQWLEKNHPDEWQLVRRKRAARYDAVEKPHPDRLKQLYDFRCYEQRRREREL